MENYELGQHTASLDRDTWQLAISGTSGSIVLSAREASQLLDLLYSERTRLYRCANGMSPEPEPEPRLSREKPWLPIQPNEEF